MEFDSSLSNTADQPDIAKPAAVERNIHNLKTAPPIDVLYEQLKYLIGHSAGNCPPDCIDCRRLQQVTNWLLLPFCSDS